MGVAVGDYDGDGFPDLYVTQYGRSILYHNNGDGTFTDVTEQGRRRRSGMELRARSGSTTTTTAGSTCSSASFVEFNKPRSSCGDRRRRACIITAFRASSSRGRAGSFTTTATAHSPMSAEKRASRSISAKAWGVVATDINNDGRMDLFVANDTVANFLFLNRGGRFEEVGLAADVAYSADGPGSLRHGRGFRRLQPGWLDGSVRRQHRPGNVLALPEQPATRPSTMSPCRWALAWPRAG